MGFLGSSDSLFEVLIPIFGGINGVLLLFAFFFGGWYLILLRPEANAWRKLLEIQKSSSGRVSADALLRANEKPNASFGFMQDNIRFMLSYPTMPRLRNPLGGLLRS